MFLESSFVGFKRILLRNLVQREGSGVRVNF